MIKLEIEKGIDIMKSFDYKTILKWILPILICLSSFCMVAQKTSTPKFHEQSIQYLDEKRNTVMTLAARVLPSLQPLLFYLEIQERLLRMDWPT